MNKSFVSVVIPVLNDSERLKTCLEALDNQTYPINLFEVIIVDNGSTDDAKKVCMECGGWRDRIQIPNTERSTIYLFEHVRGLHRARNTGITAAKGEVLAFTDADCIPASDWIEKGVAAVLATPNCGLVAGRIDVFAKNPGRPTAAELFEIITAFRQKEYIDRWHFGAPANVFTKKEVMEKIGLFDGTLQSGADVEWGQRVFAAGLKQIYADDVVVKHPARRTLGELCKKHVRVVGGLYDIQNKQGYSLKRFFTDLKDDWPQGRDFINILKREDLGSFHQKLRISMVMLCVKAVRIFERLKKKMK